MSKLTVEQIDRNTRDMIVRSMRLAADVIETRPDTAVDTMKLVRKQLNMYIQSQEEERFVL